MKFHRQIFAMAIGLGLAHGAMAASQEFIMPGNTLPGACTQVSNASANTSGNTYQCAAEGSNDYTVDVNAYAAATGSAFQAAKIEDWSGGFGVSYSGESGTSPEHAMDNNGKLEMLMFSFDSSFALSNVTIGWPSSTYDTDISILAWTGAGDPRSALTGSNENNLLATGWDLVGHYDNLNDYEARAVNGSALSSSYWIISAFSKYGDASAPGWDGAKDYMKLYSIKGQFTCVNASPSDPSCNPGSGGGGQVSEPGSMALAGLALAGVFGVRRRRARRLA
jgi:MYXO-CTERM domain-containing protein